MATTSISITVCWQGLFYETLEKPRYGSRVYRNYLGKGKHVRVDSHLSVSTRVPTIFFWTSTTRPRLVWVAKCWRRTTATAASGSGTRLADYPTTERDYIEFVDYKTYQLRNLSTRYGNTVTIYITKMVQEVKLEKNIFLQPYYLNYRF